MTTQPQDERSQRLRGSAQTCPPPCPRPQLRSASLASAASADRKTGASRRRGIRPELRQGTSRGMARLLELRGLTEAEASTLTAYVAGLRPTGHGWTLGELNQLLFLRWRVDSGRLAR